VSEFLGYRLGEDYMSIASKWLHSEKHYCVNIISTTVLRGVWLMRNDLVFGRRLVRCEKYLGENPEADPGMEMYIQGGRDGELDEVVYFPGAADKRAAEDCKRLKLSVRRIATEMHGAMIVEG
jgi:hypothetical protein